jgi:hypothetical protein
MHGTIEKSESDFIRNGIRVYMSGLALPKRPCHLEPNEVIDAVVTRAEVPILDALTRYCAKSA